VSTIFHNFTFHTFTMGDVDDPDIYVAEPIWKWQQTEKGAWVMQHAQDLTYSIGPDHNGFGYRVLVEGALPEGVLTTEYLLRWT
jgi:hypothetical protein